MPAIITVAGPVAAESAMRWVGLKPAEVKYSVALPMMMPASRPQTIAHQTPVPNSSTRMMKKEAITIRTELKLTPRPRALSSCFWEAPSLVRTTKIPTIESSVPTAAITIGATTALSCRAGLPRKAAAPRAAVARIEPAYDS